MKRVILYFIITVLFLLCPITTRNSTSILIDKEPINEMLFTSKLSIQTELILNISKTYLGIPYNYGSANKKATDCSGLILQLYKDIDNINLPRTSYRMSLLGGKVTIDSLQSGDLLFFNNPVSHVAMYINNGRIIHSTSKGVIINEIGDVTWNSYWIKRYKFSKRLLNSR